MSQTFQKDYKTERTIDGVPREIAAGTIVVPTMTIHRSWEDRLTQRAPDDMLQISKELVDALREELAIQDS